MKKKLRSFHIINMTLMYESSFIDPTPFNIL